MGSRSWLGSCLWLYRPHIETGPEVGGSTLRARCRCWLWRQLVEIEDLHVRVLGGNLQAATEICEVLIRYLRPRVCAAAPRADRHLIEASIEEAVLTYLDAPERYDAAKGTLPGWLTLSAINKVRDGQRSARRRLAREVTRGVDLAAFGLIDSKRGAGADREAWIQEHREALLAVARTDRERAFLAARLDGAPLEVQGVALGLSGLSAGQLRIEIHRVWDLIRRRLRWRRAHGPE